MDRKCLIIQPAWAHYRRALVQELLKNNNWKFFFAGDTFSRSSVELIDFKELISSRESPIFFKLKNVYLFGRHSPLMWQYGLLRHLIKNKYEIIIITGNFYYVSTWVAAIYCLLSGRKCLFWTHGFLSKDGRCKTFMRNTFYGLASGVLLYGQRAKEVMDQFRCYRNKLVKVIYNSEDYAPVEHVLAAWDSSDRLAKRRELFINSERPIIVAIGRLTKVKKIDLLIEAAAIVDRKVNLLIVGEGGQREFLEELANSYSHIFETVFAGAVYKKDAAELLLSSDICVIPGNVGLSALHAMYAGLPVISHNNFHQQMPEHEAILEGETGSFYRAGDLGDLAEKMDFWLNKIQYTTQVRKACTDRIRSAYSTEGQAEKIIDALNYTCDRF